MVAIQKIKLHEIVVFALKWVKIWFFGYELIGKKLHKIET